MPHSFDIILLTVRQSRVKFVLCRRRAKAKSCLPVSVWNLWQRRTQTGVDQPSFLSAGLRAFLKKSLQYLSYTSNTWTHTLWKQLLFQLLTFSKQTPTLPHTNEVGLKQVALSSSIKKGKKVCCRVKHNRKPLQSNSEKKAWSWGKGAEPAVLLQTCCVTHLVSARLWPTCMIKHCLPFINLLLYLRLNS